MWKKVINILMYAGIEKEEFHKITPVLQKTNRKNMLVYTSIAVCIMLVMLLMSLFVASLVRNRPAYLTGAIFSVVLLLVNLKFSEDRPLLIYSTVYIFIMILFAFGIALGTFMDATEASVSFPVLLVAVPLLFSDTPLRMNLAIIIGIIAYIVCAKVTQSSAMLSYNLSSVIPYGILSLIVSTYMMHIKLERNVLEQRNIYLSESDQLTGLKNRRSYENHLQSLRAHGHSGELTFAALDINGLKSVNDNLGHYAGDELIRGAANCIETAFGRHGLCYRTGGDEFMVIFDGPSPCPEELIEALNRQMTSWKGVVVSGLSISIGIASAVDAPKASVDELVQQADAAMYAYKNDYYRRTGIDRRHS